MKDYLIILDNERKIGPLSQDEVIEYLLNKTIDADAICEFVATGERKSVGSFIDVKKVLTNETQIKKTNIFNILMGSQRDPDEKLIESNFKKEKVEKREENEDLIVSDPLFLADDKKKSDKPDKPEENDQVPEKNIVPEEKFSKQKKHNDENTTKLIGVNELLDLKKIEEEELVAINEEKKYFLQQEPKKTVKTEENVKGKKKTKKEMSKIVAFSFLVVIIVLLSDEEGDKEINPISPNIAYPLISEFSDTKKSVEFFQEGSKLLKMYDYESKLKAANFLRKSYEYNADDKVLAKLVYAYGLLLPHYPDNNIKNPALEGVDPVSEKMKGLNITFDLLKRLELKSILDQDIVIGKVLFLKEIKKYKASIITLLKYQVAGGKVDLFYYLTLLDLLRLERRYDLAEKVYEMLKNVKVSGVAMATTFSRFLIEKERVDEAKNILEKVTSQYPDSVELWLEYANVLIFYGEMEKLETVLKILKELSLNQSPLYFAGYLKYLGMFHAYKKENKKAVEYFKKSLIYKDSSTLRSMLASLSNASHNNETATKINDLITQSKIIEFIEKSKEAKKIHNWESATLFAIEAVDLGGDNIEAKMNLANLQAERGYFSEALTSLEDLSRKFISAKNIKLTLIKLYIDCYKFYEAGELLASMRYLEIEGDSDYLFLRAYFYFKSNEPYHAHLWFRKAVKKNPFDDRSYYYYAQNFMKFGEYNKALFNINKAIDIDPEKVEYRLLYGEIMYFLKGVDFAIGYLNGILNDASKEISSENSSDDKLKIQDIIREVSKIKFEETSQVVSQVAIYYYKSGQVDMFEKYKKILEENYRGTKVFYEFLIKQSKIDDRPKELYEYYKKLLEIDPGNLKARMEFVEYLMAENKMENALSELMGIKEKLISYPKVLFYISKIHMLKGDYDKALEFALEEKKRNSHMEYGHLLLGDIYFKKGDLSKSRESYQNALSKNPRSSDALTGLGDISFNENQLDRALDLYLRSSKENFQSPLIWKKLGDTYKLLGQRNLAISSYEQYLSLAPDAEDRPQISTTIQYLKQF